MMASSQISMDDCQNRLSRLTLSEASFCQAFHTDSHVYPAAFLPMCFNADASSSNVIISIY